MESRTHQKEAQCTKVGGQNIHPRFQLYISVSLYDYTYCTVAITYIQWLFMSLSKSSALLVSMEKSVLSNFFYIPIIFIYKNIVIFDLSEILVGMNH